MEDLTEAHPTSPLNSDGEEETKRPSNQARIKIRPSSTMHIPGHLRKKFYPKKEKSGWIFFLLPGPGQRLILAGSICFVFTVILCAASITLLVNTGGDHGGLQHIAVAIIASDLFAICLVWDGVYAEAASRLNVSGLFAVVLLVLATGGVMESTIKWREGQDTNNFEHYVYLGSMLLIGLKGIAHIFLVINWNFLPSVRMSSRFNSSSSKNGDRKPLIPREKISNKKKAMRVHYEAFISALNLDLGLCVVIGLLCWQWPLPPFRLETMLSLMVGILDVMLVCALPFWSILLWLSVVNEMLYAAMGMFYTGTVLLWMYLGAKLWIECSNPRQESSARAHQNIICICCVMTFFGRLYLGRSLFTVQQYLGNNSFKQQVNRLRFYSREKRMPGISQYGTLCS
mmetsp:Transcript_27229/g.66236  ORF Transcript_27229/g.66236 Transcript_27229/m.66236 type:complete len:399 (-) Transcript_27229:287-1483(-)